MTFPEILDALLHAPGARGAAFLDPQGQIIAQVGDGTSLEVLGAYQSVWLAELNRASERAGLGFLSELSLDFSSRKVWTAEVKEGYFLLVVFDGTGVPSAARAHLEETRRMLDAEIG